MVRYNYLRIVTKSIRDSSVREAIASEIMDHIDDQKAAYMEDGMDEKEAELQAVLDMGDPEEVGEQFALLYHPTQEQRNMILYAIFSLVGVVLFWGSLQYDFWGDPIVNIMAKCGGYFLMVYGLISGIEEKYWNLPFYYGKNQRSGFNLNSYGVCAVAAVLVSRSYIQWFMWTVLLGVILWLERELIDKKQRIKTEHFIWKTGVAASDIAYKGKAVFDGEPVKVRVRHDNIKKGTPVVIVNVDGFHLIVEPLNTKWSISLNGIASLANMDKI